MNVRIVLAELNENTIASALERMEAVRKGLPMEASFCCYQTKCESVLPTIQSWVSTLPKVHGEGEKEDLVLVFGNEKGLHLGKKYAAEHGMKCHTEVMGIEDGKAIRKVYSTHVEGIYEAKDAVVILSASGPREAFEVVDSMGEVHTFPFDENLNPQNEEVIPQKEDLGKAKVVLLGGKGLGNKAGFEQLEALAKKMGVSCGCTRLVALSGWAPYDKVVGLSGWSLGADVCITFGVSGAGPLLQGLENVGKVIAINTEKGAPIFRRADYGIVADCKEIMEAMEKAVTEGGL